MATSRNRLSGTFRDSGAVLHRRPPATRWAWPVGSCRHRYPAVPACTAATRRCGSITSPGAIDRTFPPGRRKPHQGVSRPERTGVDLTISPTSLPPSRTRWRCPRRPHNTMAGVPQSKLRPSLSRCAAMLRTAYQANDQAPSRHNAVNQPSHRPKNNPHRSTARPSAAGNRVQVSCALGSGRNHSESRGSRFRPHLCATSAGRPVGCAPRRRRSRVRPRGCGAYRRPAAG